MNISQERAAAEISLFKISSDILHCNDGIGGSYLNKIKGIGNI